MLVTGFSLGCLAVLFMIILRDFRHLLVARVFLLLLVTSAAFLLRNSVASEYKWILGDIMTAMPAAFWLLCQLAFSPKPNLRSVWAALAIYSFVIPAISRPFGVHGMESGVISWLGYRLPQLAEYAVLLNGLWVTAANWRDDLIEGRRQLRMALLVSVGAIGLCITIALNTGHGATVLLPLLVASGLLWAAFLLLTGHKGVLLGAHQEASPKAHPSIQQEQQKKDETKALVAKLEYVMEDEKFYRTEKLTLKMLAEKINLPEYKTRALINETFNYRNFNDYVNQLRIDEACQRLTNEADTPIQNIALDVGYRTLSSFNRAFKDIMFQTPTAFRAAKHYPDQTER